MPFVPSKQIVTASISITFVGLILREEKTNQRIKTLSCMYLNIVFALLSPSSVAHGLGSCCGVASSGFGEGPRYLHSFLHA